MPHNIHKTTKLTDQRWLNLYETTFDKDGKEGKWVFASRRRVGVENFPGMEPNAVVVVPVLVYPDGTRKLVLIKEYRVPIQTYEYHFPAGLLEKGETVEECVKRELKEEAGFDLLAIRRRTPPLVSSAGMSDETAVMVFADCTPGDGKQALETHEDIEVLLLTHQQVSEYADKCLMYAAKTWPVLFMYQQLGSLDLRKTHEC